MPNGYIFNLMSLKVKNAIECFFENQMQSKGGEIDQLNKEIKEIKNERFYSESPEDQAKVAALELKLNSLQQGKASSLSAKKEQCLKELAALNELDTIEAWGKAIKTLLKAVQSDLNPIQTAENGLMPGSSDASNEERLLFNDAVFDALLCLAATSQTCPINQWLLKTTLSKEGAAIDLEGSPFNTNNFGGLDHLFQFLGITAKFTEINGVKSFSVPHVVLPQVMALLGNIDTNAAKQHIVKNNQNYLQFLQQAHSDDALKEDIRVDLACLFLHKMLSQYSASSLGISPDLVDQLKENNLENRKNALDKCRKILSQKPGLAKLLALPYIGDDFAGVSRTLGAHFGQLCQAELFIQLEEEGLKFYCTSEDANTLMKCFNEAGFSVTLEKKENGPIAENCLGFENNNCVLRFPHGQIERLFEIAQYNPGNVRAVVDILYQAKKMNRSECLTKEAIANVKSSSSKSNHDLKIDITASRHPADSKQTVVRVHFTAPILAPSLDNPQRLILVLDDSGSMKGERINCLNQAVHALIEKLTVEAPGTRLTVLALNEGELLKDVPISGLTADQKNKITNIKATDDTPLLEATIAGVNTLRQETWSVIPPELQDATAMILLTDGDVRQNAAQFMDGMNSSKSDSKKNSSGGRGSLQRFRTVSSDQPPSDSGSILFKGKRVQGFGTKKFPNRRPFVLVPIGVGKGYKKPLLESLGQQVGYGFYDVPEPSDTAKAITAASRTCLPKTAEITFGMGTEDKAVAQWFKPLLSGQDFSHCFTVDASEIDNPSFNQVLLYGQTPIVSELKLSTTHYDYTVIADYILQMHDQLIVKKLGSAKGDALALTPLLLQSILPELIGELYELLNQLGDTPHPLLDHVRREIYASIDQLRAKNADIYSRLSVIGRRANGFESRFQDIPIDRENTKDVEPENAAFINSWSKNSQQKSEGVRQEINRKLKDYFGYSVVLTANTKDFSVNLAFDNEETAENFSLQVGCHRHEKNVALSPEVVIKLLDRIAVHNGESTLVQQRNLLQRFVGIGIEEALGSTETGWPSGLRFEAGHPWFVDGKGNVRRGVLELQQAFVDAGHPQQGLTGTLATLLGVVIERAAIATQISYQEALPSVMQFTNPVWNIYHGGYQFDLERVGNVRMAVSQTERHTLLLWLQAKLQEQGLGDVVEPRYFAKGEINKCILKCKQPLTEDQKLAISAILKQLMPENELNQWNALKVNFLIDPSKPKAKSGTQKLSDFPELENLFIDPISLDLFENPVITPSGQTYSRATIESWLKSHSTDPITKQPLSVHDLRENQSVSRLLDQFEKNGVDLNKNPVDKKDLKVGSIENRAAQAISEFFSPPLKDQIQLIDHPNLYTVIAVAAAMLAPGEGCLDKDDVRKGLRLPTLALNFDGSLTFTFDSAEYTQRLCRALKGRGLDVNQLSQSDLKVEVKSVNQFLSNILKIDSGVLTKEMKARGMVATSDNLVDMKAKQSNLEERLRITELPLLRSGLNQLSNALQGNSIQWEPYQSTGVVQCALQNFIALHADKGLTDQEKSELQRVSRLLMDDETKFTSGLKRDENIIKFVFENCKEGDDTIIQSFAEQDAKDLLKGTLARRIIHHNTDITGVSDKVNAFLQSTDAKEIYSLPAFLPQGDKETVNELILTGGGCKGHRSIIKIVKVGVDDDGKEVKLGTKPTKFRYFHMEFNAGAGAFPVENSPNQVWSVATREVIAQENKTIEETLQDLIVAQRMLLCYRSIDEIKSQEQVYTDDVVEAEKWLTWFKQVQNCLGDFNLKLCQKGPAQVDDSCELTTLNLFLDYHLSPELAKRFWQFAKTMNANMTVTALKSKMDIKSEASTNQVTKDLSRFSSRFATHTMVPLKHGYTAFDTQVDKNSMITVADLDNKLEELQRCSKGVREKLQPPIPISSGKPYSNLVKENKNEESSFFNSYDSYDSYEESSTKKHPNPSGSLTFNVFKANLEKTDSLIRKNSDDEESSSFDLDVSNDLDEENSTKKHPNPSGSHTFNVFDKANLEKTNSLSLDTKELIRQLELYTTRINNYLKTSDGYAHGFWCFKKDQAANRKANHQLAIHLSKELKNGTPISEVFSHLETKRKQYIDKPLPWGGLVQGIYSDELNAIIKAAEGCVAKEKQNQNKQ